LQVLLGVPVIPVGKFAYAVLELEVPQVLVDGGLALIQVQERRFRLRLG